MQNQYKNKILSNYFNTGSKQTIFFTRHRVRMDVVTCPQQIYGISFKVGGNNFTNGKFSSFGPSTITGSGVTTHVYTWKPGSVHRNTDKSPGWKLTSSTIKGE